MNIKENNELDFEMKQHIRKLYKTFYYPTHVLTRLDEIHTEHKILKNKLKNHIEMYNKYNNMTIDEENYVKTTYENIKYTLYLINV
jgi:hypothetical protein